MKKVLGILLAAVVMSTALLCLGEADGTAALSREAALRLAQGRNESGIVIPESVVVIEPEAFAGISLEWVTLPRSLQEIADNAFDPAVSFLVYRNSEAERWAESNGRVYRIIGEEDALDGLAFMPDPDDEQNRLMITGYTGEATTLVLPDGIEGVDIYRICESAFEANETVSSIRFPGRLEIIDNNAFYNSKIQAADLPASVTHIGTWAFGRCSRLTEVKLPGQLEDIDTNPFDHCEALREVTMSVNLQSNMSGFRDCENVEVIHYLPGSKGSLEYQVTENASYLECQSKRSLKTVDFGEGITVIDGNAFFSDDYDNENNWYVINSIHLPATLKIIGDHAFSGLACLTDVNLPEGIELIGSEAFAHCRSLVPFEIPDTVVQGNNIFLDCRQPEPEE